MVTRRPSLRRERYVNSTRVPLTVGTVRVSKRPCASYVIASLATTSLPSPLSVSPKSPLGSLSKYSWFVFASETTFVTRPYSTFWYATIWVESSANTASFVKAVVPSSRKYRSILTWSVAPVTPLPLLAVETIGGLVVTRFGARCSTDVLEPLQRLPVL